MIHYKAFIIATFLHTFCFAQSSQSTIPTPPNSVHLYENIFIDKTEISNFHWLEFLRAVRQDSGIVYYNKMVPDSTVWPGINPFQILVKFYLGKDSKHTLHSKAYVPTDIVFMNIDQMLLDNVNETYFYPVVGVSYAQVVAYCQWRTATYNHKRNSKNDQVKITYRLPTEQEWIYAASANLDTSVYSFGYRHFEIKPMVYDNSEYYWKQIRDKTELTHNQFTQIFKEYLKYGKEPFFNCGKRFLNLFDYGSRQPTYIYDQSNRPPKRSKKLSVFNENRISTSAHYYTKAEANGFGISNMIGNAAEMTLQEGIAKGGSWSHSLDNSKICTRYLYYHTNNWLGFRCVAEVKSSK